MLCFCFFFNVFRFFSTYFFFLNAFVRLFVCPSTTKRNNNIISDSRNSREEFFFPSSFPLIWNENKKINIYIDRQSIILAKELNVSISKIFSFEFCLNENVVLSDFMIFSFPAGDKMAILIFIFWNFEKFWFLRTFQTFRNVQIIQIAQIV